MSYRTLSSIIRNWLARKLGKITWYGSFWCDWCLLPETNWHIVVFKNGKYKYVHKNKNQCWNHLSKSEKIKWTMKHIIRKKGKNYHPLAGKELKHINLGNYPLTSGKNRYIMKL